MLPPPQWPGPWLRLSGRRERIREELLTTGDPGRPDPGGKKTAIEASRRDLSQLTVAGTGSLGVFAGRDVRGSWVRACGSGIRVSLLVGAVSVVAMMGGHSGPPLRFMAAAAGLRSPGMTIATGWRIS